MRKKILVICMAVIMVGCATPSIQDPPKDLTPTGVSEMTEVTDQFFK